MRIDDPRRDPLGQAMLAYLGGQPQATVQVYSDVAIDDVIPARYLLRGYDEMPAWERQALRHCRGRVLDVGAGSGSHALWLQEQGLEVVALDVSPGAVDVMQQRGVQQVLHGDIFDYEGEPFDTLLLMMNGIGLVGDLHGLNDFLQMAARLLKPGGQILLDSSDIRYLYEAEGITLPLADGRYHGIIGYQMTFGPVQGEAFAWLYLDFPKLEQHAQHFGYQCRRLAQGSHYEYLAQLTLPTPGS